MRPLLRLIFWVVPFYMFLCSNPGFAYSLEISPAVRVQQYTGDQLRKGVALKTRLSTLSGSNKFGYYAHVNWEYHPLTPVFILGVAWRFGSRIYFEPGPGIYLGQLLNRGLYLAAVGVVGFELTQRMFLSIPVIYRSDMGIWRLTYLPYFGFHF